MNDNSVATLDENRVSAGTGSDIRITIVAFLAPFMCGLFVVLGFLWFEWVGAIIGLGAAVGWALWWRAKHGKKFFPRDVQTGPFIITIVIATLVFFVTLGSS